MENRSIFINDTLLMLRLVDSYNTESINASYAFYEAFYGIKYLNGSLDISPITIEICKLGKNINMKFENLVNEMEKLGKKVNEFYCISNKNEKISISYFPNIYSTGLVLIYKINNNSNYFPEKIQFKY